MLRSVLWFELSYHFKQISFRIGAVLFLILGFVCVGGGFGGAEVHKNAPYVFAAIISLFSMSSIFASTLFCANVVLRDSTNRMDQLIFTTSISRAQYFLVKFFGLITSVFILLILSAIGIIIGCLLQDPNRLGPFDPSYFLHPLFSFGLPNVLFSAAIIFATAVLTRNIRAIYAAGVLLYILYLTASILSNSPLMARSPLQVGEPDMLPLLSDPFGLSAFFESTSKWTELQKNTEVFRLKGVFLFNRIVWLFVTSAILYISYRLFNFRLKKQPVEKTAGGSGPIKKFIFRNVKTDHESLNYGWLTFLSRFKLETNGLFKHIPFMVMLLLWAFLFTIELKDILFSGPYGIHAYPLTGIIVEEIRSMPLAVILIIFFASEALNRERTTGMDGLIYSTPVNSFTLWISKCLSLGVLTITLVTLNILIGIGLQLTHGHFYIELPIYLSLYYYSGLPVFLFAILVIFIQNLISNKYLGMLLSTLIALAFVYGDQFGLDHYMLRYAMVPEMAYSYFNGFGHYSGAFNWYMLFWIAIAAVLGMLTVITWNGSSQMGFVKRLIAGWPVLKNYSFFFLLFVMLSISSGAYIFYRTNIEGKYMTSKQRTDLRIVYEKKFSEFKSLPQPAIIAVRSNVILDTKASAYKVNGVYKIKNDSDEPITTLWLNVNSQVNSWKVSVPVMAQQRCDPAFNQLFIDLKIPLKPGQQMELGFSVNVIRSGFSAFNAENYVGPNGTYIELEKYVPHFGYDSGREINDRFARAKAGLPVREEETGTDKYHLVDIETTVATAPDEYAVTVGELKKSWLKDNKRYFTYRTSAPVNFMFAISSARYKVDTIRHNGVDITFCYYPKHSYDLKYIQNAVRDALDYGNKNFGAYPLTHFTLAEIPHYKGAATAYPGVVFSAERLNFQSDFSDQSKVNQSYVITAHEVGHQWWANIVAPVYGPGSPMLTESLSKYTEGMLLEQKFGKMKLRELLKMDNQIYFASRSQDGKELPLTQADDQSFVYYQKGIIIMHAIRSMLGESRFNDVLQKIVTIHKYPGRKALPADLVKEFMNTAHAEQQQFIEDSFNKVMTYRAGMRLRSVKRLHNGKFEVRLTITASNEEQGKSKTPYLFADIAVFNRNEQQLTMKTRPLFIRNYKIDKPITNLTLLLNEAPVAIAFDPYQTLLIEDRSNLTLGVK